MIRLLLPLHLYVREHKQVMAAPIRPRTLSNQLFYDRKDVIRLLLLLHLHGREPQQVILAPIVFASLCSSSSIVAAGRVMYRLVLEVGLNLVDKIVL